MENHIKMTKSFLQLLTKLENSIDTISTSTIDINEVNEGSTNINEGSTNINEGSTKVNDRSTEVNEGFMESSNISCSDIDNIYTQLIHKDDLINKLKEIINCKNDKISTLVKDISEIKNKNDYLEKKIIELTQTVKLLHDNIDRNTIVISNENYSPHQL